MMLTEKLSRIPDLVEMNAILRNDPAYTWRRAANLRAVARNENTLHRMGARAVDMGVDVFTGAATRWALASYTRDGYSILGTGAITTVLEKQGQVTKVVRTTPRTAETRQAMISNIQSLVAATVQTHTGVAVPTEVDDNFVHPRNHRPYVVLRQQLVHGYPLERSPVANPTILKQVRDFAEKSLDEMVPNGAAPDVMGAGNLYVSESDLALVDTVALPHDSMGFPHNARRLAQLARVGRSLAITDVFGPQQ